VAAIAQTRPASGIRTPLFLVGIALALIAFVGMFTFGILFARGTTGSRQVSVVIAAQDIAPREPIDASMLTVSQFPATNLPPKAITSVADLKGKNVAVNQGSVSEWFLAQVLKDNGLSLSDVKEQNMKSGEAGAAFVASRVDVAVTWEPWLSKAKARTDGHILVSSKQYPDLIMDSFAFRKDFVQKYPDTVKDFMKAYYDAFNWMQQNQTEALKVIGDAVGESSDDVKADLGTMTLFDLSKGKEIMGTSSSHGKIYDNVKAAAEFWKGQGKVDKVVSPNDAIDPSFINSL